MKYDIVEFAGKKYPIFFGFNGLRKYCGMTGTSLNKLMSLGQDMTLDDALKLVLIGLEEGGRKSGQGFDMTIDELGDLLDTDMTGLTRALEIFGEQMGQNVSQPKVGEQKAQGKNKK